jgi:protein disulfide-isomerase
MKINIIATSLVASVLALPTAYGQDAVTSATPKAETKKAAAAPAAKQTVWTEDIDGAFKTAAETGKPVFIDFTGSDWCYWCILADKHIFTNPKWLEFSSKMVCLKVDFPKANRPSREVMDKRYKLAREFKVRGYPTFVLVSSDRKELSRFVAGRKTASEFIAEVRKVVK